MKMIKKINNNCALCLDSKGRKVVAFGKGIGFRQPPYEIELEEIQRIYYDIDDIYIKMIHDIPEDIIELSAKVIEYARTKIDIEDANIVFTLADHIHFAIKRYQKNISVHLPVIHDIQYLYDEEMEIGKKALKLINSHLKNPLPDEEAIYIALHIINSETMQKKQRDQKFNEQVIADIIDLIEKDLNIKIHRNGYHYSRFVTHLTYLIKRGKNNQLETGNKELLETLVHSFPEIYNCTQNIQDYLSNQLQILLNDEECAYLIMHINRLCSRENYDTCD